MAAEIAEQPDVLERQLATVDVGAVRARLEAVAPRFVLLAARGTSDHAALYGKYLAEVEHQLPAGLVSPSTLTVYGARPDLRDVLFVAISQSGASPDLVESTAAARDLGALTVAVTNTPDSPLASAAEQTIDIAAGVERSVAATKTYTAELLALYRLFVGDDAAGLPEAAAATLAEGVALAALAARWQQHERFVLTGRGYSYPAAREGALKLMETAYVAAHAFSGADLVHGPLAMIDPDAPVLVVEGTDAATAALAPVLQRLGERGADVLRVAPDGDLRIHTGGLDPRLVPIVQVLPLQQFALCVALDRGADPDRPRGLSKVTRTR
jgi:glucosamine--fructose-6-phosphate aminotransferase (isomerizing)